jgi:peptidyl-prolyl cis-trans isomerase B (cyclophilin B)
MHPGGNPFDPQSADPFGPPPTPASAPPSTGLFGQGGSTGLAYGPTPSTDYNTFAVLSPIFAVVVPPAGVVLGHLALPQIRRTGERGRAAAIAGLVIGYLMCVVLIAALIWLISDSGSNTTTASTSPTASTYQMPSTTRASTVTSVAPPTTVPRIKLDLATVPIGACVEIQLRSDEGSDALDLFKVDCEHKEGVYTVTARVSANYECRSVYVAAPPDRSFALCLNPY